MLNKKAALTIMAITIVAIIIAVIFLNKRIATQYPDNTQQSQQSGLPNISQNSGQNSASQQNQNTTNITSDLRGSAAAQTQQQIQQTAPVQKPSQQPALQPAQSGQPLPTQQNTITPAQAAQAMPLPTSQAADPTIFTVTTDNSTPAIKAYAQASASAAAGFDLINNWQGIAEQFQSLDPATLSGLAAKSQATRDAIKKIPVPSDVLGMAERYYLLYDNYANIVNLTLAMMDPKLTDAQRQQKYGQFQQDYGNLQQYMEQLNSDQQIVSSLN